MTTNFYLVTFLGDRYLVIDRYTGRTVEVHRSLRDSRNAVMRLTARKVQPEVDDLIRQDEESTGPTERSKA
jgi:hypothetical protein